MADFDIGNFMRSRASRLFALRTAAKALHLGKDIRAAGNEVEFATREFLTSLLPREYEVLHGHVVDRNLLQSNQLDIIITDAHGTPMLYQAQDGTSYVPIECAYAIGEVKTTYEGPAQVKAFIEKCQTIQGLIRPTTPPTQLARGLNIATSGGLTITSSDKRPYKNPLFRMILFLDSQDFSFDSLKEIYESTEPIVLPNIICFIDRGVFLMLAIADGNAQGPISLHPEFGALHTMDGMPRHWGILEYDVRSQPGAPLAVLYMLLFQHLTSCILTPPPLIDYLNNMIGSTKGKVINTPAFDPAN